MPIPIHEGDQLTCAAGDAPAKLKVSSQGCTLDSHTAATVKDDRPNANIPPMGTCKILTAKALGVPTPCQPQPQGWQGPSCGIAFDGTAILTDAHKCPCSEGGVIQIAPVGAVRVAVS